MANQEHFAILKQGVEAWNKWRVEHPRIQPDFRSADLQKADLRGVNLRGAIFIKANLIEANLSSADLANANLNQAKVYAANLTDTNLNNSLFSTTDFTGTDLTGANLSGAILFGTYLSRANLIGANLTGATLSLVTLGEVDLRAVIGLETIRHTGPSTIGTDTIMRSEGDIPEVFLRGIGVPDSMIEYMRSLVGKPIDYYSCFISYSSKDQDLAERLYADLQSKGVRCWFAPEDMKVGDKIRPRIDESIRRYDKLLLVLSKNSIVSDWVEKEVETAFEKERQQKKLVLFPIRIDNTVIHTTQAWAADIRRTRHIGDFTKWKEHDEYQKVFNRLLSDLKAES